jgi:hypothetical protein
VALANTFTIRMCRFNHLGSTFNRLGGTWGFGGLGNMTIHVRHLTMYDSSFDERKNVSRRMRFFNARAASIA